MNSYTKHIIAKMQNAKQQVMKLMAWEEVEYNNFQYKMGCQYLQAYIPNCPTQIDELTKSRIFWNWWKNEWLFRDTAFINSDILKVKPATIVQIYLIMNDPDILCNEIYPSGTVLNSRYSEMIRNVQKNIAC